MTCSYGNNIGKGVENMRVRLQMCDRFRKTVYGAII